MTALNCIGITDSGRAQRDSEMENVPAPRGMRRRPRSAARAGIPAVVAAIAMYIFVTISRVSDEFPSLHLALVTAGITAALALFGANRGGGSLFRLPETRAVLALFGLAIVTIPFSFWPGQSFTFVTRGYVTLVFLFLVIIHCVRSARAVQTLFWSVLAAMVFLEISLMLWGKGDRPHVTGTYDSNDIAFVMVCGFPLGAMWFLRGSHLSPHRRRSSPDAFSRWSGRPVRRDGPFPRESVITPAAERNRGRPRLRSHPGCFRLVRVLGSHGNDLGRWRSSDHCL